MQSKFEESKYFSFDSKNDKSKRIPIYDQGLISNKVILDKEKGKINLFNYINY